jgi:hypothetical protein
MAGTSPAMTVKNSGESQLNSAWYNRRVASVDRKGAWYQTPLKRPFRFSTKARLASFASSEP